MRRIYLRATAARLPEFALAFSPSALRQAYRIVRANGGAAGGDDFTVPDFGLDLENRLSALSHSICTLQYRPGPLRRVRIPKPSGKLRQLAIPCVSDRVVQTAMLNAITPVLDARMSAASFGYRPGRSVAQALAMARGLVASGRHFILDADIRDFFGSVPHGRLFEELSIWIEDDRYYALIALWIQSSGADRGLPQGAPISPLLANLYMHPLDRILAASGIAAVRYADDFLCLCATRRSAFRALRIVRTLLARRGLALAREKTRIVEDPYEVVFLGERLAPDLGPLVGASKALHRPLGGRR